MKQLLIVNSSKALNATGATPKNLSGLEKGAITFFEVGADAALAAAPTKNFGIALGLGGNNAPLVIPEVNVANLVVTKALPTPGAAFSVTFTFPTPVVGKEYTVLLTKKGAEINERTNYHVGIAATSTTAATEAEKFRKAVNARTNTLFPFVATGSGASVVITCANVGELWAAKLIDTLAGVSATIVEGKKAVGDKAFVAALAQKCAGDKGFNYLADEGKEIDPGYPEDVEDLVPNASGTGGASTAGYAIFTLHFATGRAYGKQLDEKIWQDVHIAVPITATAYSAINTILPEGDFNSKLAARVKALEDAG